MTKLKTVYDFLKNVEIVGTDIVVYIYEDKDDEGNIDPIWEGSSWDTPYWVADLKLDWIHDVADCEQPIEFRLDLGEKHNHRPGFVISCTEAEDV